MRWIGSSGKAKGVIELAVARRTDWDAEMLRVEKEAEKIRDVYLGKQADRFVAQLRTEWMSLRRMKEFAKTGINSMHVGLEE